MKKILSILTICLMSFTLVGNKVSVAKTEEVPTIEKEETKTVELSNEKVEVNETDEKKKEFLNILNRYYRNTDSMNAIMWYLEQYMIPVIVPDKTLELNDELKEISVNYILNEYFADDIEMQEKIKQLPLDYQYVIYEQLK